MSNVVNLRVAQSRASTLPPPSETFGADIADLVSRILGLQSKAKEEISHSILMLDIAAQHARQIAKQICDPAVKENFSAHVATIEQLLQLARGMALKL